ncbi:MAG: hypothetical protein IGQ88_13725 [Gloeomargaritaceae cyanobacterium C42_A2020_066]|nr:hypothetical protein [Gloeomargaritaceae cyanobacterium C42_A2020_066]
MDTGYGLALILRVQARFCWIVGGFDALPWQLWAEVRQLWGGTHPGAGSRSLGANPAALQALRLMCGDDDVLWVAPP